MEFFINLSVSGIDAAITDHLVILFRDVPDEPLYELHDRDSFFHIFVILMTAVMESDKITVIEVNSGSDDNRAAR